MNHETAVSNAREIADRILAPAARQNDKDARFSSEAIAALGSAGLLGIMLPAEVGGSALGPRTLAAVVTTLAETDASASMVYLMHMCGTATIAAARSGVPVAQTLKDISAGRHLTTLAFSEAGSRSHFWAPVSRAKRNGANVRLTAQKSWVTSAGHAQSYVVSALAPDATGPTDSTLYLLASSTPGLSVAGPWDGLGMRANASAPMILEDCEVEPGLQLTDDGAGFKAMLEIVLPLFNLGTSAVALGLCRAAVAGTAAHLKSARFEHLGQTLGESLPTLRAQLATMQIDTDGLAARVDDLVDHLERPRETTMLRVLEAKAAAGDTAIAVTSAAMRVCGGAAFSRHLAIERLFRDAHAGAVMAPTGDVLREFIGKAVLGIPLF
ncbi:acyl-CoA dehydrogenase family protein [Bradyrhizobium sp. Ash2021]|uniref:acyl-CoA dehydrogenase family protein n=1 Tax=Bradyrhizobium sp. Ash2021 TaxID=2954771 RepID=UPI0028166AD1|nr:acyl-CoA dehydrogenase family protein [Bradyrhizobium sp. Ash2021]WMT75417.1 acyl-CoA/acyl-ACP dehydrogenase [Bradyrhizobium sp. Ash2021]WMT75928.1 acyl-CoA/acyl-ACP dehydrogenase [Bradyrhizobium sp. Ash2021]